MILLSICVPTYNRAKEIERLLGSIDQSIDCEVVICDDGSTDNTSETIEFFSKKFDINYLYQNNTGRAKALYAAISAARGSYIVIMDSDDYFLPDGLRKISTMLISNPHDDFFIFGVEECRGSKITKNLPPRGRFNYIALRADKKLKRDLKEVVRRPLLQSCLFLPEDGCRRVPTSLLWSLVAERSECLSIDTIVARKEYLSGGMSHKIFEHKIENPRPMLKLYFILSESQKYRSVISRWRYRLLWARYFFHVGGRDVSRCWQVAVLIPGFIIFLFDHALVLFRRNPG